MTDIYAFGPDWALPAAVQDNVRQVVQDWLTNHPSDAASWWKNPLSSATSNLDTVTAPGAYPMLSAQTAAELGIPVPSVTPGWLEVTHGYNTRFMMQEFHSYDGTSDFRRHMWSNSWRPWVSTHVKDTGWRTISPAGATAGRMIIRRVNEIVEITFDGITWGSSTGKTLRSNLIPSGFLPDAPIIYGTTAPNPGSSRAFTLHTDGAVVFYSLTGGDVLNGTSVFTCTKPWPGALPGAAA